MTRSTPTLVVCAVASLLAPALAPAQEPRFTSVEILPAAPTANATVRGGLMRGGRFELHAATVLDLIRSAWGTSPDQVIGGPAWLDTDRFDLFARGPADLTPELLGPMLQAVIVDRFTLRAHPDTRPFPGYALTAAATPRLKAATGGESGCTPTTPAEPLPNRSVICRNITMPDFAQRLPQLAGNYFQLTSVADATHLEGAWDFTLRWTDRRLLAAAGTNGLPIYDALTRQLGLKLETRDVPVRVLVIDSIAKPPPPTPTTTSRPTQPPSPEFEVATIKLSPPGEKRALRRQPAGRLELRAFTLRQLIKFAWDFQDMDVKDNDDLLRGGPASWNDQRFDILAQGQLTDLESVRLMLRALLIDRFRIQSHTEQRPVPVYELEASNPKLQRADATARPGCRNTPALPNKPGIAGPVFALRCRNMTMSAFAAKLQNIGGIYTPHPVIDATRLTGAWDFTITWSPPHLVQTEDLPQVVDIGAGLTIVEALRQQLGLRLRLQPHPMPVLVIDQIEPLPTAN